MRIRPSTPDDAEALTDLHLDVWDEAYAGLVPAEILRDRRAGRAARVLQWRQNPASTVNTTALLTEADAAGRLLGFVSTGPGRDPESHLPGLELMALYVRSELYGKGGGRALLRAAVGEAPAYLWVLDGNVRAIAFYERQGFRFDGATTVDPHGVERRMVRSHPERRTAVTTIASSG